MFSIGTMFKQLQTFKSFEKHNVLLKFFTL